MATGTGDASEHTDMRQDGKSTAVDGAVTSACKQANTNALRHVGAHKKNAEEPWILQEMQGYT